MTKFCAYKKGVPAIAIIDQGLRIYSIALRQHLRRAAARAITKRKASAPGLQPNSQRALRPSRAPKKSEHRGWCARALIMMAQPKKPEKPRMVIRLLMIGDSSVGKTSRRRPATTRTTVAFSTMFMTTIGVDYRDKLVTIEGRDIKLQIWDTAGQERSKPDVELLRAGGRVCRLF